MVQEKGVNIFWSIFRHPVAWLGKGWWGHAGPVTPMHRHHFSKLVNTLSGIPLFYAMLTGKSSLGYNWLMPASQGNPFFIYILHICIRDQEWVNQHFFGPALVRNVLQSSGLIGFAFHPLKSPRTPHQNRMWQMSDISNERISAETETLFNQEGASVRLKISFIRVSWPR